MDQLELYVRIGLLGTVERRVIINGEYIEFEYKDLTGDYIRIYWKNFNAIRYGKLMIEGHAFLFGQKHNIILRDINSQLLDITLISPYGFRKKKNQEQFDQIIGAIYHFFLNDYIQMRVLSIQNGTTVTMQKLSFSQEGIQYRYGEEIKAVSWQHLELVESHDGFYIQDERDKERSLYLNYLEDWNAWPLYSMIKSIQQIFAT